MGVLGSRGGEERVSEACCGHAPFSAPAKALEAQSSTSLAATIDLLFVAFCNEKIQYNQFWFRLGGLWCGEGVQRRVVISIVTRGSSEGELDGGCDGDEAHSLLRRILHVQHPLLVRSLEMAEESEYADSAALLRRFFAAVELSRA